MTGNETGAGARAHRSGKRRFWMTNAVWIVVVLVAAFAMRALQHGTGPGSLSPALAIGFAIVIPLMMMVGGLVLSRVTDELDAMDNLVALAVGFVSNMVIIIGWFMLFLGGLAGVPSAVFSLVGAGIVTIAVYGWRKVRR
jgi:hypothetical protein